MNDCGAFNSCLPGILATCLLAFAVLSTQSPALAQNEPPWKVTGAVQGKVGKSTPPTKGDVSGIACVEATGFSRVCMIVDDESQGAQIVVVNDGELIAGQYFRLIDDEHDGAPIELDAEAVAYADGAFYIIGSHGRSRHENKAKATEKSDRKAMACRRVIQVRFNATDVDRTTGRLNGPVSIRRSERLPELIKSQPELAPYFDRPLDENGLTIEGVSVRGGTLYAGMRGPVLLDGSAVILSTPLNTLFDNAPAIATLHRVSLGQDTSQRSRGVRDLATFGERHLILAGPVNDPPEGYDIKTGDYAVFLWANGQARQLLDLPGYGYKMKPEALLPLEEDGDRLKVLLLFDGPVNGAPRSIVIPLN